MINNTIRYFVQSSAISAPNGTIDSQLFNPDATATYIQDGQIVVTDNFGNIINTGTSPLPTVIKLKYRQGDTIHETAELPLTSITARAVCFRPALEQSTILGYNATNNATGHFVNPDASTGVVDDAVNYMVTLFRNDDDSYMGIDRPKTAIYVSGSNPLYRGARTFATQQEVVNGLADIMYKEFIKTITGYQQVTLPIKVERTCSCSGGGSTLAALGQTLTVYNESPYAVAGGAVTLTKGSLLRLGGHMYVVAETCTASTKVVLDIPYQGVSEVLVSGTNLAHGAYTYAPTTLYSEYWGLQITGKGLTYYKGLWKYAKVRFAAQVNENVDAQINSFGITDVAIDTKGLTTTGTGYLAANTLIPNIEAYDGIGTWQSVNENEWANLGFYSKEKESLVSIDRESKRNLTSDANGNTCKYSLINLEWKKQWNKSTISVVNDSGNVIVAIPLATYTDTESAITMTETKATAATYGFVTVLDTLLTTTLSTTLKAY